MKKSTIPIGFPASVPSAVTQQSSSSELSDELNTALAAGRWWAIMEVSHPISEEPESDFTSGQWRGAPEKGALTSSLSFTHESEKSSQSGLSDSTQKSTEQERTCSQKKLQGAHVPAVSFKEQHVPPRLQKRGILIIPEHLKRHLQQAALQTPVPAKSPQDAPIPLAVTQQSSSSELSDFQRAHVPALSFKEPHVPLRPQQRGKVIIPEHLKRHLEEAALQTSVPASVWTSHKKRKA